MNVSRNIRVITRLLALSLCAALGLLAVSVMNNQDALAQAQCPPGTISDGTTCVDCPIGTFKAGTSGMCETCPDGFVTIATGQTQCSRCAAGQGENDNHTACEPCQPGNFSSGGTSCLPCADGTFAASASATECTECGPGQAADRTGTMCIPCPPGEFKAGATGACQSCPDGQITSVGGQTECTTCADGQGENDNHTLCVACLPGTFSSGGTSCLPCPIGTIAAEGNATQCEACPVGSIINLLRTECTACGEGMGANDARNRCETCPAGTYSPDEVSGCMACGESEVAEEGSASCTACAEGMRPVGDRSTCAECGGDDFMSFDSCITCPAGFGTLTGGTCEQCGVGFYSGNGRACNACSAGQTSNEDFTACIDTTLSCPDNQVASHNGCVICADGYAPQKGGELASRCELCPVGTFSEAGNPGCSACAPGTYANAEGSNSCSQCEEGRVPNQDGTDCVLCQAGEYVADDNVSCARCPAGTVAPVGSEECNPCPGERVPNAAGDACVAALNCEDGYAPNAAGICQCERGTIEKTTPGPARCVPSIECEGTAEPEWRDMMTQELQRCVCPTSGQSLNSEGRCGTPLLDSDCLEGESLMTDDRTGESFCVETITTPVAVRYNSDNCEDKDWQTGFDLQGSSAAEVCYIPILIVSESDLPSATASSRDENAPSPRQSLSPGRKADGCLMTASNGYIPDEYLRCTAVFGAVGEFPERPDDFIPTEQSLYVLPNERGVSEVRTAAGNVVLSAPSAAVDTPTGGDGASAVPQGDGGKSSRGVAIGVVAAVGLVTWMLSDGDLAAFNWQPEMSVEHHDGVSYYSYGSRVDFTSDNWTTHWRASQAHYDGEAEDWVYGAGASWTDGVFSGAVNSRAQGLDTDVGFSLSAEKVAGLWRLRSGVNTDWRLDELNSEWSSHLYLSGETIYRDWHFTPSAGLLWEGDEQFGDQTFIHLNISRQF